MKPPFVYYGSKGTLAPSIVKVMPKHRVYIEPYFGSGAVFFAKPPAQIEVINDLDGGIVAFFTALRDQPEALERACRLTPFARDEYDWARSRVLEEVEEPLERARLTFVRISQSIARSNDGKSGWAVSNSYDTPGVTHNWVTGRFAACAERLRHASIENCDALDLVVRLAKTEDTLVYLDPPYLRSTRTTRQYRIESDTDDHHQRLAAVLDSTPATVLVSGYNSELYEGLFKSWYKQETDVLAHMSNKTGDAAKRTEVLWSNRDLFGQQVMFA